MVRLPNSAKLKLGLQFVTLPAVKAPAAAVGVLSTGAPCVVLAPPIVSVCTSLMPENTWVRPT